MSLILNLETSTKNCSVSIAKNGKCLTSVEECLKQYSHSEKLHTFIEYAVNISGIHINNLKSICVSKGPGSYTSLRIGASAAKGLCYALNIPLLSVDTLTAMINKINIKKGFFIPMIHVKYDFFYISLFNESKERLSPIRKIKLDSNYLNNFLLKYKKAYFIGNIVPIIDKKSIWMKKNFLYKMPSAMDMSLLSYKKFCEKKFNKIEKFTPFYL